MGNGVIVALYCVRSCGTVDERIEVGYVRYMPTL